MTNRVGTLTYRFNISIPLYFKYSLQTLSYFCRRNEFLLFYAHNVDKARTNQPSMNSNFLYQYFVLCPTTNQVLLTRIANLYSHNFTLVLVHFSLSVIQFSFLIFNTATHVEPNVFCLSEFIKVYLITHKNILNLTDFLC